MKIKIKGKEIELKNKMRAYLIYEQITDKAFNPQTYTDLILYLYSLIIANDMTISLTFDELLDYLDENQNVINEFSSWILEQSKMNNELVDVKKKMGNS